MGILNEDEANKSNILDTFMYLDMKDEYNNERFDKVLISIKDDLLEKKNDKKIDKDSKKEIEGKLKYVKKIENYMKKHPEQNIGDHIISNIAISYREYSGERGLNAAAFTYANPRQMLQLHIGEQLQANGLTMQMP